MKYKLNPDYVPQEGHYFDSKDWTNDEIKWISSNSQTSWGLYGTIIEDYGFLVYPFIEFSGGEFYLTHRLEEDNTLITKDMIFAIPKGKTLAEECLSAVGKDTKVTGKQYISDLPVHTSLSARDIFPAPQPKMFSINDLEVTWNGEVISGFTTDIPVTIPRKLDTAVTLPSTIPEIEITGTVSAPEPKSTLYAVADVSCDILGGCNLTQDKKYEVTIRDPRYWLTCDKGRYDWYHKSWFSSLVRVYDNDPEELEWTGVEFEYRDYIDLKKHSPEQIRHIYSVYPHFDKEHTVADRYNSVLVWDEEELIGTCRKSTRTGTEYTYDDLFKEKV